MRLRLDPTSPNGVSPALPANDGQNVVRTVPRLQRLNDLEDVRVDGTPSDKQALAYDAATNKFIPQTLSTGGTNPDGKNQTNLSSSTTSTTITVASDTGTDATLASASSTQAGVLTASDKTKLDGIEEGAQVNTINASDLATVATSGDYSDLSGTPTIPSTIVQSIVQGDNITIDSTDPSHPVISSTATGGGTGATDHLSSADTNLEMKDNTFPTGSGVLLRSTDGPNGDRVIFGTGGLTIGSNVGDDGTGSPQSYLSFNSDFYASTTGNFTIISPSGMTFQGAGYDAHLNTTNVTASRSIELPDEDGTLATTAYVDSHAGGGSGAVSSVNTKTGDVVLTQDDIADGTTAKQYTATEKTKLAGIETGAQVNTVTPSNAVALTNKDLTGVGNTFPTLNQNTTGTAANVTGTVTVAHGGTGLTSLTSGNFLTASSTSTVATSKAAPTGAVVGTSDTQTLTNKTLASPIISTPTGLVKSDVGLGNVTNDAQLKAADLDTDASLTANSDTKIASQKAVKSYVTGYSAKKSIVTVDDLPSTGIVSAHRGGGATDKVPVAPEGTLNAYSIAMEMGANIIDMDYHTTANGVQIVMHDATVDRVTNGLGNVSDHVSSALPDVTPSKYVGGGWPNEHVPSIEEVFIKLGGKTLMTVEAKEGSSAVAPLAALIKKYGLEKSVFINTSDVTVVSTIVAAGCLAHLWAWSDTTKVTPGIAAGAHLIEVPYNATTDLVAQCQAAVADPTKNLRWFIAGPIDSRTQVKALTPGIMGHVTDALGMTNRVTGDAPLVTTIKPSLMAGKRGIGWRYYSADTGLTAYPTLTAGSGLKFNITNGTASPPNRGIYLGDMSGTMPSSYTMSIRFTPGSSFVSRTDTTASIRGRFACTIPDAGGQDTDTDGYVVALYSTGRLSLWTSNGSFGNGISLYNNTTASQLVAGNSYTLVFTLTATTVRISCPELSKDSGAISNTDWRGGHQYLWTTGNYSGDATIFDVTRT